MFTHDVAQEQAEKLGRNTVIDLVLGGHSHQSLSGKTSSGVTYIQPDNVASTSGEGVSVSPDGTVTITVTNTLGKELPHTGGPGTRLFTILGSILILGAGVLLWRRRRLI
jgi:LPXTG-motif cell wall-anchored protein